MPPNEIHHHPQDTFERGLKFLDALDALRWEDEAKFKDLVVALAAVDRGLRNEDTPDSSGDEGARRDYSCRVGGQRSGAPPLDGLRGSARSMFDVFRTRACRDKAFTDVTLAATDERRLSDALTQQLTRDEDGCLVLPTLRYTRPAETRGAATSTKPLTSDQRAQNILFLGRCRSVWREAQREVRARLGRALSRTPLPAGAEEGRAGAATAGLRAIGVRRLAAWAEADAEAQRRAAREAQRAREERARVTHAGFVKRKDRQLLRVPRAEAVRPPPAAPRFDLSRGARAPVRPRTACVAATSLDLARGQGLELVHALGRGAPGRDGDLERSRRQLLARGHGPVWSISDMFVPGRTLFLISPN